MHYVACWTEDDGVYACEHEHVTIADAMRCLIPDGGTFIRAMEGKTSRSLTEGECAEFLVALKSMPWSKGD
jgi:hypothetical protein